MYFKIAIILAIIASLVGCDRFLGKEPKKAETIQIRPKGLNCLQDWPEKVLAFIEDRASESQTKEVFSCMQSAMNTFTLFMEGQDKRVYEDKELKKFINEYMFKIRENLKEYQLSDEFVFQMMKLKVFLIGGSPTVLTKVEIEAIVKHFDVLAEEAIKLRGKMKIILLTADAKDITDAKIQETQDAIKNTVEKVLSVTKVAGANYEWTDFEGFLKELNVFLHDSESTKLFQQWYPLANSLRKVFMGDRLDLRSMRDYRDTTGWIIDAYGLVSRYVYMIQGKEHSDQSLWRELISLADMSFETIEKSPIILKSGYIPVEAVDEVFDELEKNKILNDVFTAAVLKDLYRKILAHAVQAPRAGRMQSFAVRGIDALDIATLKFEYQVWKISQLQLLAVFNERKEVSLPEYKMAMNAIDIQKTLADMKLKVDQQDGLLRSWRDWLSLQNLSHPLIFTDNYQLTVPLRKNELARTNITFQSGMMVNALRSMIRFILLGYGESAPSAKSQKNIWDAYMTEERMIQWEEDFRDFGRAVKFLDPRSNGSAKRTFGEGNFFTFSSQGDGRLSGIEMTELFSLLISGGKATSFLIMEDAARMQCTTDKKDVFNQPVLLGNCFKSLYVKNFSKYYSNLPALLQALQSRTISMNNVYDLAYRVAEDEKKEKGTIVYGEIRTMSVIFHYIEALMAVFDRNHDNYLDQKELSAAFPRFQQLVLRLNPLQDVLAETAFLYIVTRGELPDTSGFWSTIGAGLDFTWFSAAEQVKPVSREQLLKVLTIIKAASKK
jgi:hypothetical protein